MIKQAGFTLVEMLVAVGLTALVATGAYQTFDQAVLASSGAQARADQINQLDRTWQLLEQDLRHARSRQNVSSNPFIESAGAFYGAAVDTGHFDEGHTDSGESDPLSVDNPEGQPWFLRLNRGAWGNPLQLTRSELRGVAYHLEDGRLWRLHWPIKNSDDLEQDFSALDFQSPSDAFAEDLVLENRGIRQQLLLEGVEGMSLRYLPGSASNLNEASWQLAWPPVDNRGSGTSGGTTIPLALEMSLYVEGFGDTTRVFQLGPGL